MSKLNIEAALKQIPSRFELINTASRRAHQLQNRLHEPLYEEIDGDKFTVIALKEIAANRISNEIMDNQDRMDRLLHEHELKNLDFTYLKDFEQTEEVKQEIALSTFHASSEDIDNALAKRMKANSEEQAKQQAQQDLTQEEEIDNELAELTKNL